MKNGRPRTTKVTEVTLELADDTSKNTTHRIIPGQKICHDCLGGLKQEIKSNIHENQLYHEEVNEVGSEDPVIIEI